jgi:omega-hydroxy-beta-dihydromenaquinone-9 sulfotransferase
MASPVAVPTGFDSRARRARSAPTSRAATAPALAKQPGWMPRIWNGCDVFTWFALLRRNQFAVHPSYWYIAVIVSVLSVMNTLLGLAERAIFGRAVAKTTIAKPPVFLIGHWRSGTTLLHELMICDDRFGFPTTYQCLMPHHFLLTERVLSRMFRFLLPKTRPMDNMPAAFERPQEDEFAMCMLGAPSPYSVIAFPNRRPAGENSLDPETISAEGLRAWKRTFYRLLQRITWKTGKQLVLKSPPHTFRIKILKQMFPDALFINIVRNPFDVYPSSVNLWRTLYQTQALQSPCCEGLEENVLSTYVRMFEELNEGKRVLRADQFYELTYEDLVNDPICAMKKIYDYFGLADFGAALPKLERYLAGCRNHETNRYRLSAAERAAIGARWGGIVGSTTNSIQPTNASPSPISVMHIYTAQA